MPVPEIRTDLESDFVDEKGAPPKEVQKVNIWLGEKKTSDILKDILEVATMIKNVKKNKKKISSNYLLTLKKNNQWPFVTPKITIFQCPILVFETL